VRNKKSKAPAIRELQKKKREHAIGIANSKAKNAGLGARLLREEYATGAAHVYDSLFFSGTESQPQRETGRSEKIMFFFFFLAILFKAADVAASIQARRAASSCLYDTLLHKSPAKECPTQQQQSWSNAEAGRSDKGR
jgi:hypothetical protein